MSVCWRSSSTVVDVPVLMQRRGLQFLDKVVDTPVVYNDKGHGPDRAVPGQGCCYARCFYDMCSFSAKSLTRPLCTKTGVMVQTVQFLDKVVDVPVVCATGAHGS